MTNKSTKRALLTSIMALLLCFTMLLGTTYAWFTDSVSSANNIIKSGNLDIGVYYAYPSDLVDGDIPADAWKPVTDEKPIFNNDALWEPGYTEAVFLKFVNEGTLALQYQMKIDILKEVIGKNEADEDIQLSKYINAYACNCFSWDYKDYLFAEREDAISPEGAPTPYYDTLYNAANGDVATPNGDNPLSLDSWQWLEPAETTYATVVLWMPTTVGNEANYKKSEDAADPEKYAPHIDLGVTVLATQYAYEQDSFGNDYDKDAEFIEYDWYVEDLAGLKQAFAEGGNVMLMDDVAFDEMLTIESGTEVYLNMNGKTLTVDPDTYTKNYWMLYPKAGSKLVIDGNGTFDLEDNYGFAIMYPAGEVIIENGNFIRNRIPEGTPEDEINVLFTGVKSMSSKVVINGGYFDSGYYDKNAADVEAILAGTTTFTETADDIAKRGNSRDANLVRTAIKNNVSCVFNFSGYGPFTVYGGTFVGANPAWGDEGCAMPTTPNYLRPWSYYQGTFLEGQVRYDDKIEIPAGYTITEGTTQDGRPTYTVNYSK